MTDYLEELLDQLEEEEAETAAHWMDALRPALFDPLSESSGSAEPEAVGRQARSPAAQRAENGLEGPPPPGPAAALPGGGAGVPGSAGRCGRLPGFCSTGGLGGRLVPCPAGGEAV